MPIHTEFRLERDLIAVLRAAAPNLVPGAPESCRVLSHPQVGALIPDLVLICIPAELRGAVHAPDQSRVSGLEAAVLSQLLVSKRMSPANVAERLYSTVERIDAAVHRLKRCGMVREMSSGLIVPSRQPFARVEVIAVEAKLARWRQALAQARNYLSFSNRAYVALPSSRAQVSKVIEECRSNGVGVISVQGDLARIVLPAPQRPVLSADWVHLVCRC